MAPAEGEEGEGERARATGRQSRGPSGPSSERLSAGSERERERECFQGGAAPLDNLSGTDSAVPTCAVPFDQHFVPT